MLMFVGIWFFIMRRVSGGMSSGLMSIGKSRAKVYVETETKVAFADVAGVDEAKEELIEIVNFLKNPADYSRLGGHAPKGILLVGPPWHWENITCTSRRRGKRVFPFFSISGSEFVEMFVGVGAARVRFI